MQGALLTVEEDSARASAWLHPTAFARYTKRDYRPAELHWRIGSALRDVEDGKIDRLMIFMPPRMGKSELASIRFPAWYLGRNPEKRIIAASYGKELAADFGRKARNVVASQNYQVIFPGILPADDSAAMTRWDIRGHDGGYVAAGVGGPLTGRGAHILLIDDPVKNREEADSEVYRESAWNWYTDVAYTRLEKDGAIVLIMTRWHEDDLAGRLLSEQSAGGDRWEVISLPAMDDAGIPLWAEKFSRETLEQTRINVGSRAWQAMYMQSPSPQEGALLKRHWWKRYGEPPPLSYKIQVWDTAFQEKTSADYSVCETWGQGQDGYYLLDVWRARVEYPELEQKAKDLYAAHKPGLVLVEDKASGQSLLQSLRRFTAIPLQAVKVDTDKVRRVHAISGQVEGGRCFLPEAAQWVSDFIEECAAFPQGKHDDQVDGLSMALEYMAVNTGRWRPV